ncbi:MAG: alpha/beta fold hydrolase [Solirubrobacteraceae bacterium]
MTESPTGIAYDRVGSGPALVMLHPLGADRQVWAPIVERLALERELVTVDLPGFGESAPLRDETPTARALAGAVAMLLSSLGIERPHVTGNSLGGWVALELGLRGVTRSTSAIAPAGLWPQPLVRKPSLAHRLAKTLRPLVGPVAASACGRRLLLASAVAHPERVPAAQSAHLVRAYASASGFIAVNKAMRAGRFEDLARIPGPLTLIWPEHDRLVDRPRQLPANVRNIVLKDAGHMPFWDAPDEVAAVLREVSA